MPQTIDRAEVQRLLTEGAQLVDVLPAEEYREEHIPGAIHMPLRKIESEASAKLDRGRPIIVYCWDSA